MKGALRSHAHCTAAMKRSKEKLPCASISPHIYDSGRHRKTIFGEGAGGSRDTADCQDRRGAGSDGTRTDPQNWLQRPEQTPQYSRLYRMRTQKMGMPRPMMKTPKRAAAMRVGTPT